MIIDLKHVNNEIRCKRFLNDEFTIEELIYIAGDFMYQSDDMTKSFGDFKSDIIKRMTWIFDRSTAIEALKERLLYTDEEIPPELELELLLILND